YAFAGVWSGAIQHFKQCCVHEVRTLFAVRADRPVFQRTRRPAVRADPEHGSRSRTNYASAPGPGPCRPDLVRPEEAVTRCANAVAGPPAMCRGIPKVP